MTWLYGDSTRSPLEINYIEFLRLTMDFCVEVLLAEEVIAEGRDRRYRLESAAEEEVARLEKLGSSVQSAADKEGGPIDSPTGRCAAAIGRIASETVKAEVLAVRGVLNGEVGKTDGQATRERERCVKALERLLIHYDLPDTKSAITVEAPSATSPYTARLRGATPYGLETLLELDILGTNAFAHEVRVERFMDGLEVKVPEMGGWLRKQSRIVPHRLGKYRLAKLSTSANEVRMELRQGADPHATGFDVTIDGEKKPVVHLTSVAKDVETKAAPFEPDAEDSAKLIKLSERLAGAVAELTQGKTRKALVEARLDGEPLVAQERPSTLVERLIGAIAPTVQEITRHSLTPNELVLRRLLGGDRREEVFVSRSELAEKLEPVPTARRNVFDPLGLGAGGGTSVRARTQPVEPEMVVEESSRLS